MHQGSNTCLLNPLNLLEMLPMTREVSSMDYSQIIRPTLKMFKFIHQLR